MFNYGWKDPVDVGFGVMIAGFGLMIAGFGLILSAYALVYLRVNGVI